MVASFRERYGIIIGHIKGDGADSDVSCGRQGSIKFWHCDISLPFPHNFSGTILESLDNKKSTYLHILMTTFAADGRPYYHRLSKRQYFGVDAKYVLRKNAVSIVFCSICSSNDGVFRAPAINNNRTEEQSVLRQYRRNASRTAFIGGWLVRVSFEHSDERPRSR